MYQLHNSVSVAYMGKARMKMDKLKPCPFCAGKAEMLINEYEDSRKEYLVACTECHCQNHIRRIKHGENNAMPRRGAR